MGCPVLIASPYLEWGEELKKYLSAKDISSEIVSNGKECQLRSHQEQKNFIVLDIETKSNSSIEVLQYLRKSSPLTKVIVIAENKAKMNELQMSEDDFKKLGAHCVLVKPFDNDDILEKIDPIKGKVEKISTNEDDFRTYVLLHNQLRILHQSKGKLSDKLQIISNIVERHEALIFDSAQREKTVTFTKETAFLIAEVLEKENDYSELLKSGNLVSRSRTFRVIIFSLMTAQFIDWSSRRTLEALVQGILLRDLGKIIEGLPTEMTLNDDLTLDELAKFKLHPWKAVVYLEHFDNITEPVKQIIYQRYEFVNASGFPMGIAGNRIYPPAKILSLSECFSDFIIEKSLSPLDGLRAFMQERAHLERFDPIVIKGLITAFINKAKRPEQSGKA